MKEDRRFSGMQIQASELIEQAFNRGFKAGLEEAKNRSKAEEEKFHVGDVVKWSSMYQKGIGGLVDFEGYDFFPLHYGIVTRIAVKDGTLWLSVLCSEGVIYMIPTKDFHVKRLENFPCIKECLNFLKNKEDNKNQND